MNDYFLRNRLNYTSEDVKEVFMLSKKNRSNEEQMRQPKADAEYAQETDANKKQPKRN